ncbi:MAG: helix-turn-helix domain-containing protein [Bacteroidales bacterium]|nr:helix-turn-helix domain-containing protein [Bacteroidales bacterium]
MSKLRGLLLTLVFILSNHGLWAQSSWLFGTDYDMPNSLVNDITIGANHMVWVATEDGLCKYDGYQFTTYRHEPGNPNSIQANYVRRVYCDKAGHLLVGTRSGLQVYRPETDNFSLLARFEDGSLTKGDVTGFLERKDGELWMSGNSTCGVRFDENDTPILYKTPLTDIIDYTEDIVEDSLGYVWVSRRLQELYRMNVDGEVECIRHNGADVAANNLFGGADGNVYIGMNWLGLHRYNNKTQQIEKVSDTNCLVREMGHLHDGRMFVATDNVGLMIFDYATQQLTPFEYRSEVLDPHTQKVHAACEDEDNNMWLAIYQQGVLLVPEDETPFRLIGSRSREYNIIGDKCVTSMIFDHDHVLWVTTDNGGLYAISLDGKQLAHFDCHGPRATSPFALLSIFEDSKHRLWYGSYNQGYGWVDRKTGIFRTLDVAGVRKESAEIYRFIEDKHNRIWAASMGTGVLMFDEETLTMSPAVHSDSCRWNTCLIYDEPRNQVYVGSYNGLTIVNAEDPENNPRQFLPTDIVFDILQLDANTLCLCTGDGIVLFDLNTFAQTRYNEADGLLSGNYYSALADNMGHVWLGSNVGLTCFDLKRHVSTNYSVFDGLQSNEFAKNAKAACHNGNLCFGGSGGITWFNPAEISRKQQECEARIVDVVAGGDPAMGVNEFQHDDNTLVISMGLLPIMQNRRAIFAYRLDGDSWTYLPMGSNTVSLSHLTSGSHTFIYKALLNGVESEIKQFSFSILYPWYYRWWAWLLWSAIALAIVAYGIHRLRKRKAEKHRLVQEKHLQAINEAKMQFFTNMAHEIRTPMTLIVGPLMKLMKQDEDPSRQHSYQRILRNSNRILSLMNQLLDVRKLENSQMDLRCELLDMGAFTADFCQSFDDVASLRQLSLTVENHLPQGMTAWIDKQHYEKILSNLLSNAMKFTPEGGSILVQMERDDASERYPEGSVRVLVTDTGSGVPEEAKAYIFERFYQDKNGRTSHVGTGIGLYLTRELMELHQGLISVVDNPAGKGSQFILTFPLGDKHLQPEQKLSAEEVVTECDSHMAPQNIAKAILSTPAKAEKVRRTSHKQKTILLLEDEDEVRDYLVQDLSQYHKVYTAANGVLGLAELGKHMPDIIITDVMMPEMDGIEFVERVRKDPRYNQVRIIMLTAKIRDDEKIEGIETGADAYITKPYNIDVLFATIDNLLTSQERVRSAHNVQPVGAEQVETPGVVDHDAVLLEKVARIINREIGNSHLTTEAIAQEVGMSRVHLFRKIKDLTGKSPSVYLRSIRLSKAAEILANSESTMSEVALAVGFENQGAFSSAFKDQFGMSPSQYKQLKREEPAYNGNPIVKE